MEPGADRVCSGEVFLEGRLEVLRAACAADQRGMVIFDLDNTVFDTRPRTLGAARSFDDSAKSTWFAGLDLSGVRRDGRETALQAGLSADVVRAFHDHWNDFFWRPENLVLDEPIPAVVAWARRAREVGAEVRYLTGRIAMLHDASVAALRRVGLEVAPDDVVCKPDLTVRTAPWKGGWLARWHASAVVGWFMTEGRRDIAAVQAQLPDFPCVMLDCSFEEARESIVRPDTPLLARAF